MLDTVLHDIVKEVAFEGDQGCTFDQFFQLVETLAKKTLSSTKLIKPLQFDDHYNAYIWSQLQYNDQLLFTENGIPFDPSSVSYQELKSNSNHIIVKSTEEAQDLCIYGNLKLEKKNLVDKHKQILSLVAKSRSKGISQYQLGESLNMDARSIFYYLKKLDQLGLIVKEEAYVAGMNTRVVMLKQFAENLNPTETNNSETNGQEEFGVLYRLGEFKENVLKQLEAAKDHTLLLLDLVHSLGLKTNTQLRWARVRLADLHEQEVVEKFTAFDGKRKRYCVRLPSTEPKEVGSTTCVPQEKQRVERQYTLYRDLPTDYILYQNVVASGENGLLRQDLIDKYPFIDPIQFSLFFENATIPVDDAELSKYLVYRTEELRGKSRQFRYFAIDGWQSFCHKNRVPFTNPELERRSRKPEALQEPKSIDEIGIIFRGRLPPKRQRAQNSSQLKPKKKQKTGQSTIDSTDAVMYEASNHSGRIHNKDLSILPNVPPSIVKKLKKVSHHDNTRTRRQTILLDILKNDHIREHNVELFKQFKETELAAAGGQNLARKTFDSIIQQLHDQQKLRLYSSSVQMPFGLTEIKTFILHPGLTGESEQVKDFIKNYNNQNTDIPIIIDVSKRKQLKKIEVEMPLPPLQFSPQKSVTDNVPSNGKKGTWHFHATEYGYINSKWLRARELHMALFEYYKNNGENATVDMSDFMKKLSLRTLMRFFGVLPFDNEILFNYLKTDANRDIPMQQLPVNIKPIITKVIPQIRRVVVRNINVLRALELIELATAVDMEIIRVPQTVTLRLAGLVKDYALKERPLLATIALNDLDDVRLFWADLQAYCTELHDKVTAINDDLDPLVRIAGCRGWTSNTLLTPEQKVLLNSFVDFEAQTVPVVEDRALRAHLIRKTGLPSKRIKSYYNSIMLAFKKYKTKTAKAKKRLEKESSIPSSPAITELMKASLEKRKVSAAIFKMKQTAPFIEPTFIGSRKIRRLRLQVEPYQDQDKPHGKLRRNIRDPFSKVEKDVLLHAYSIMKARADDLSFFWQPISQVIPNRTPEKSRRVLNAMLSADPNLIKTIDWMKSKWLQIYERGIARKEIIDDQPWDTLNYDLLSYFEYYVLQLQRDEIELAVSQSMLPATYKELKSKFHIIPKESCIVNPNETPAPKADYANLFKEDVYDTAASIPIFDETQTLVELVMTLIKMILMTADENYCPRAAYTLFKEYPDTVIEQAVENMKLEGLIVSDKARYGRIPGRNIIVSEKFVKFASGVLPFGLFQKAREFHGDIADKKYLPVINANLNSGVMAAALDLLSQRRTSIHFLDKNAYIKSKQVLYYPRASAGKLRSAFIYKNLDLVLKEETPLEVVHVTTHHQDIQQHAIALTPTMEQIYESLNSLGIFAKSAYEVVRSFNKRGASWSDIVTGIDSANVSLSSQDLSKTLQELLSAKPALVLTVGFKHLRYVSIEFFSAWTVKMKANSVGIPPLMWYDVSGQVIQPALDGYAETVMGYILTQPGITYANLREKTQGFFTEFELYHLLKYLIDSNKVVSKKFQRKRRTKRTSIFDKRPIISVASGMGVNDDEVSHYWLSRDYYI